MQQALAPTLAGRKVSPQALAQLQAEALALLIDRRLVEKKVSAGGKGVTDEEIDTAQAKIATQLEAQKTTLERLLAERNITLEAFRKQLSWQVLWDRTMEKQMTDAVLEDYFDDHKKEFDGTEVRASHILLRPARTADPAAMVELLKQAKAIRDKIEAGTYSFEEAAAMFSSGPSKEKGGDVGFFPRHGLMAEPFSRAAFSLPIGEISQQVTTPFGVHLIKVTEIKDGKKAWTDVRDQLKPPARTGVVRKDCQVGKGEGQDPIHRSRGPISSPTRANWSCRQRRRISRQSSEKRSLRSGPRQYPVPSGDKSTRPFALAA